MTDDDRACGECGKKRIPRGMDWPVWRDGKPICIRCQVQDIPIPASLPGCPGCGAAVRVAKWWELHPMVIENADRPLVICESCCYVAGGINDTEEQAIRAHLLNCQRLTMLMPVVPKGWRLVPEGVTLEMQRAYFKVIDANMDRLNDHHTTFGRHDANRLAYRAMLDAAPAWKPEKTGD